MAKLIVLYKDKSSGNSEQKILEQFQDLFEKAEREVCLAIEVNSALVRHINITKDGNVTVKDSPQEGWLGGESFVYGRDYAR